MFDKGQLILDIQFPFPEPYSKINLSNLKKNLSDCHNRNEIKYSFNTFRFNEIQNLRKNSCANFSCEKKKEFQD